MWVFVKMRKRTNGVRLQIEEREEVTCFLEKERRRAVHLRERETERETERERQRETERETERQRERQRDRERERERKGYTQMYGRW